MSELIVDAISQLMRAYDGRSPELDPLVLIDLRALERVFQNADRHFEAEFVTEALKALAEVGVD